MTTTAGKLYELQTTGSNSGTWGEVLNDDVFTLIDNNLSQTTSLSLASTTPITLSASEAQMGMLVFTGTLSANIAVTSGQNGVYWVENRTSGSFYVSLTNGVGTPMLVPQGSGRQVWADATYGVRALNLPPVGSFLDLGAATPHPSMLATTALVGEYLLCDGSSFLTTGVTANLYVSIGTTWGAGPLLPDLRGRARFGKDNMGGSTAGRITNAGSSIVGTTVGAVGGAQNVTLTQAQLPVALGTASIVPIDNYLRSSATIRSFNYGLAGDSQTMYVTDVLNTPTVSITNGSGGNFHTNMPPTAICNVLIKV